MDADRWTKRSSQCAHVHASLPREDAGISQFRNQKGFLPLAFFDHEEQDHRSYCWTRCATWVEPEYWKHTPSGSLLGGPYGVKWPILLLLHIQLNALLIKKGTRPPYKDPNGRVIFQDRDVAQIHGAIEDLCAQLRISVQILSASCDARDLSRSAKPLYELEGVMVLETAPPLNDWEVSIWAHICSIYSPFYSV